MASKSREQPSKAEQDAKLPDLAFLELRPHKGRQGHEVPLDGSDSAVSSGHESQPTPASLLSPASKNRDNITHLEALYQAKAWSQGIQKKLIDRLELAKELEEGFTILTDRLAYVKALQAVQQMGEEHLQAPKDVQYHEDTPEYTVLDSGAGDGIDELSNLRGGDDYDNDPIHFDSVTTVQHPGLLSGHQQTFTDLEYDAYFKSDAFAENLELARRVPQQTTLRAPVQRFRSSSAPLVGASQPGGRQIGVECGEEEQGPSFVQELAAAEEAAGQAIVHVRVLRAKWNAGGRSTERWMGLRA